MINLLIVSMLLLLLIDFNHKDVQTTIKKCTIVEIYETVDHDREAVVLTASGALAHVDLILIPTKMKEGTYEVEVTRKGKNVYQLEDTEFVIETKYCNEYARRDDALLKVESNYASTKGVLIFE